MIGDCWVIHDKGSIPTHPHRYCARRWIDGHLDPWNILSSGLLVDLHEALEFLDYVPSTAPPSSEYGDRAIERWLPT